MSFSLCDVKHYIDVPVYEIIKAEPQEHIKMQI